MLYIEFLSFVLFLVLPISKGAMPGTFFWRPRFGIDLAIPSTEPPIAAYQPTKKNIQAGIVVLIDGYDIMTSITGLLKAASFAEHDETMGLTSGIYYTTIYRWLLRTVSLVPHWLRGNFHDALSVWHRRWKHMDAEVPPWMRKLLPWVQKDSWDKQRTDLEKYRKFSEKSFTQFYRYPSKVFHDFSSFLPDSSENFLVSSSTKELTNTGPGNSSITNPSAENKTENY